MKNVAMSICGAAGAVVGMAAAMALASTLMGCAPPPVPANRVTRSQAVVDAAEQMQAESDPRAAAHLKLAKDQLAHARKLMKNGDSRAAAWILARAEADGEAALSLASASSARQDAERTIDAIKQMISAAQKSGESGS